MYPPPTRGLALLTILICLTLSLGAQDFSRHDPTGEEIERPEAILNFKGSNLEGDYLILTYSIPFQGMVEYRLFDDHEALVWRKQEVLESGEHQLVLRKSAFRPGVTYRCRFNYKEDERIETLSFP